MSKGTLDTFFGTKKPKEEERCSNPKCRKIIGPKDIKFTLRIKSETKIYCQPCYKEKMKPLEEAETL